MCVLVFVKFRRNLKAPVANPPQTKRQAKPKDDNKSEDGSHEDTDEDIGDTTDPSQDTQEMKKRRRIKAAKRANLNETPPDDYDLEDPFICNDSSDEFQYDDDIYDDDSDSDWDDSQEIEEDKKEQKRLLREAKKFRKGK